MIDNIVVGFDGTPTAFAALDWVAQRAMRRRTRVEIIGIAGTILEGDMLIDESIHEAESWLRDRAPLVEIAPWRIDGRMPESLFAHASFADMLVVGSHRGQALRSALTGRLPLRTAGGSRVPVVVVPDDWSATTGPIVVGLDDDDSSRMALHFAAGEAEASGLPLLLVHAWQMPAPRSTGSTALLTAPLPVEAGQRKILRGAAIGLALLYPDVQIEQILVEASPGPALLDIGIDASLIVIGTHHRGLSASTTLGSVGQDVLSQSAVPVCVVRNDRVN